MEIRGMDEILDTIVSVDAVTYPYPKSQICNVKYRELLVPTAIISARM